MSQLLLVTPIPAPIPILLIIRLNFRYDLALELAGIEAGMVVQVRGETMLSFDLGLAIDAIVAQIAIFIKFIVFMGTLLAQAGF